MGVDVLQEVPLPFPKDLNRNTSKINAEREKDTKLENKLSYLRNWIFCDNPMSMLSELACLKMLKLSRTENDFYKIPKS